MLEWGTLLFLHYPRVRLSEQSTKQKPVFVFTFEVHPTLSKGSENRVENKIKEASFVKKETSFDLFACPCLLSCFRLVPYLFHLFASKRPGGIKDELCHVDVVNL